jgi:radical SAM superfamily enzyme YgiQ (UPF0313 family)
MGLKHVMICEPLELEYVAAGLPGHEVEIFDSIVERGFADRLHRFRPDVVGTSCYITGVNEVIKLCRGVKRWNPDCGTVVGGVHASLAPEDFSDGSVDCIVLGDGTSVIGDVVQALEKKRPLDDIPGLALPAGDEVRFTDRVPYMPDPDSLPLPRRDLVEHLQHKYYYLFHRPVATIKTTWGCWYRCNFCFTWRVTDGVPYSRSPASIADELEQIEAEDVYIVDDIFLFHKRRLSELAALIRERGIKKKYLVYARADYVAENEELVREWAELGLRAVFIGLEATTNRELASMDKQTSVDSNRRAVEVLRKYGVDTYGSLITQPDYGAQDWERLWRFIDETGLYYLNISPLTPLPGTLIWEQYEDRLTVDRRAHGLFDLSHVVLPTKVPLPDYYRSLLRLYIRTCLNIRRANRLTLRTRPPVWSPAYLRLWLGAYRIWRQMRHAHRHHEPAELALAMDRGSPWTDPRLSSLRERTRSRPRLTREVSAGT